MVVHQRSMVANGISSAFHSTSNLFPPSLSPCDHIWSLCWWRWWHPRSNIRERIEIHLFSLQSLYWYFIQCSFACLNHWGYYSTFFYLIQSELYVCLFDHIQISWWYRCPTRTDRIVTAPTLNDLMLKASCLLLFITARTVQTALIMKANWRAFAKVFLLIGWSPCLSTARYKCLTLAFGLAQWFPSRGAHPLGWG